MRPEAEVWVLHRDRVVLVQDAGYGVPESAVMASDGTLGGTWFPRDILHDFATWAEARAWAHDEARRLGYQIEVAGWWP